MSNLHVNLDEANKHDPKGFIPAVNNTFLVKTETGISYYEERMMLPKAINFVDGTVAPPTTADLDVYVLTGSGTEDAGWGSAVFGDWVRFINSIPTPITPSEGYLCYDETASAWKEFDGSVWGAFGGGGTDTNLGTDNLTLSGAVTRTYNIDGNELKFIDGPNTKLKIDSNSVVAGNGSSVVGTTYISQGADNGSVNKAFRAQSANTANFFELINDGNVLHQSAIATTYQIKHTTANSYAQFYLSNNVGVKGGLVTYGTTYSNVFQRSKVQLFSAEGLLYNVGTTKKHAWSMGITATEANADMILDATGLKLGIGIGAGVAQAKLHLDGTFRIDNQTTTGAAAGGDTLPASPQGFININLDGTVRKVPYYV